MKRKSKLVSVRLLSTLLAIGLTASLTPTVSATYSDDVLFGLRTNIMHRTRIVLPQRSNDFTGDQRADALLGLPEDNKLVLLPTMMEEDLDDEPDWDLGAIRTRVEIAAPAGVTGFGSTLSVVAGKEGKNYILAGDETGKQIHVLGVDDQKQVVLRGTLQADSFIFAYTGTSFEERRTSSGACFALQDGLYWIADIGSIKGNQKLSEQASKKFDYSMLAPDLTGAVLTPVGHTMGTDASVEQVALGVPSSNNVWILDQDCEQLWEDGRMIAPLDPTSAGSGLGLGVAVIGVGDVNQDGKDDLVVGSDTGNAAYLITQNQPTTQTISLRVPPDPSKPSVMDVFEEKTMGYVLMGTAKNKRFASTLNHVEGMYLNGSKKTNMLLISEPVNRQNVFWYIDLQAWNEDYQPNHDDFPSESIGRWGYNFDKGTEPGLCIVPGTSEGNSSPAKAGILNLFSSKKQVEYLTSLITLPDQPVPNPETPAPVPAQELPFLPHEPQTITEPVAEDKDSEDPMWAGVKESKYVEVIRRTDRIAFPDAGQPRGAQYDVTNDGRSDMVFAKQGKALAIVPYIHKGSKTDELTRKIGEEPMRIDLSEPAGVPETEWGAFAVALPYAGPNPGLNSLAVASGNRVDLLAGTIRVSGAADPYLTMEFPEPVLDISPLLTPDLVESMDKKIQEQTKELSEEEATKVVNQLMQGLDRRFAIATKSWIYIIEPATQEQLKTRVHKIAKRASENTLSVTPLENLGRHSSVYLAPAGKVDGEKNALAVGLPDTGRVLITNGILDQNRDNDLLTQNSLMVVAAHDTNRPWTADQGSLAEARFGEAIVAAGDLNKDGFEDFIVGAPGAVNKQGSFTVVFGAKPDSPRTALTTDVYLRATTDDQPVLRSDKPAGTLHRNALKSELGSSLVMYRHPEKPTALLVGRPINEEHPAGLLLHESVLLENHVSGQGVESIERSKLAWLATGEPNETDSSYHACYIARNVGENLQGVILADSKNERVDIFTIDLSRQGEEPPHSDDPIPPKPERPKLDTLVTPPQGDDARVYVGDVAQGFGGALAHGISDTTGDGKSDLLVGSAPFSELYYDPYYADSSPNKGWLNRVTGRVTLFPNNNPTGTVPVPGSYDIFGPKEEESREDACIGLSVAHPGDVNGDGVDDILFGSHTTGKVWVVFGGQDFSKVDLNKGLTPEQGILIQLPEFGSPAFDLARVGDVTGDGLADVGVVVANARLALGEAGAPQGMALVFRGQKQGGTITCKTLRQDQPELALRIIMPDGQVCWSFEGVGDTNQDGATDFVVTDATHHQSGSSNLTGISYLVYGEGRTRATTRTVDLNKTDENFVKISLADKKSYRLGAANAVAPMGDVNGDGYGDFLVGFDGGNQDAQGMQGGLVIIYGGENLPKEFVIDPEAETQPDSVAVLLGNPNDVGFGYAADAYVAKSKEEQSKVLVGAYLTENNGRAYLLDAELLTPGKTHHMDKLIQDQAERVEVIESAAHNREDGQPANSRFGRAVAFVGDYLNDKPTLAIGGDGVYDQGEGAGNQGYFHSAHVLVRNFDVVKPAITPNDPDPDPTEPTEPTKPGDPTQPTEPTKPGDPTQPTEPTKPGDPTQPTEPTKPTDTATPLPGIPAANAGSGDLFGDLGADKGAHKSTRAGAKKDSLPKTGEQTDALAAGSLLIMGLGMAVIWKKRRCSER